MARLSIRPSALVRFVLFGLLLLALSGPIDFHLGSDWALSTATALLMLAAVLLYAFWSRDVKDVLEPARPPWPIRYPDAYRAIVSVAFIISLARLVAVCLGVGGQGQEINSWLFLTWVCLTPTTPCPAETAVLDPFDWERIARQPEPRFRAMLWSVSAGAVLFVFALVWSNWANDGSYRVLSAMPAPILFGWQAVFLASPKSRRRHVQLLS